MFHIGVIIDSFKLPLAASIRKAVELGVEGIQLYATERRAFTREYGIIFTLHLLSGMCRLGKWRVSLVGGRRFLSFFDELVL